MKRLLGKNEFTWKCCILMDSQNKLHCNTCNIETNHKLLNSHKRDVSEMETVRGQDRPTGWYENWKYDFLICKGCDTATLVENYHSAGMFNQDGDEYYLTFFHPERTNKDYRSPKMFQHLDNKLNAIYLEIIKSHNLKLEIITAMGLRALLEGICLEENITDKVAYNLTGKVAELESSGNIPSGIIGGLTSLKFLGDDAAHSLNSSDLRSINLAIDLLEALLTHLYEAKFDLQHKAELMKRETTNG